MSVVPFFPPKVFEQDRDAALRIVREVGTDPAQRFILGEAVDALEQELCTATGARHGIACANGSGALTLILDAVGVRPGDEVIVPAYGCQPVADTVANLGATPVFVDVDPDTPVIDPTLVEAAVTPRTVAVMPAHVFSVMADMRALRALARRHGLTVVEDSAVAQGAALDGVPAGRWGDAGMFSFSQYKPLGTIGEGGIVLTDNDQIAHRCRLLRNHGRSGVQRHDLIGYCSRMDEIVARFLLRRRDGLPARQRRRVEIAQRYTAAFQPLAAAGLVTLPPPGPADGRWCHVYAVLTDRRDALADHLKAGGIGTHVYYPLPLPSQPAFAAFARDTSFPHAEAVARRNLALPVWAGLSDDDVDRVVTSVLRFYGA